jgi:hypothetical protein
MRSRRPLVVVNKQYNKGHISRVSESSCFPTLLCKYKTDSATQSASPPVKSYHGIGNIPIGRRFDPKPSFFWACTNGGILFESREHFSPWYLGERAFPNVDKNPPLVQPSTTISRFVWANSLKRAKLSIFPISIVTFWQIESRNRSQHTRRVHYLPTGCPQCSSPCSLFSDCPLDSYPRVHLKSDSLPKCTPCIPPPPLQRGASSCRAPSPQSSSSRCSKASASSTTLK